MNETYKCSFPLQIPSLRGKMTTHGKDLLTVADPESSSISSCSLKRNSNNIGIKKKCQRLSADKHPFSYPPLLQTFNFKLISSQIKIVCCYRANVSHNFTEQSKIKLLNSPILSSSISSFLEPKRSSSTTSA